MKKFWKGLGSFLVNNWPAIVQVILEAQHQKQAVTDGAPDSKFLVIQRPS